MSDAEKALAEELNRLRGRLCGLVEGWGLEERRERAMIGTLKALTYDAEARIKSLLNK